MDTDGKAETVTITFEKMLPDFRFLTDIDDILTSTGGFGGMVKSLQSFSKASELCKLSQGCSL
jgi:hypothetical protein